MLRPVLVLGGTAAGLAAILSFKTHPAAVAAPAPAPASPVPTAKAPTAKAPAAKTPTAKAPAAKTPTAKQPAVSRTLTGAAESTQYGPMQVQVTLTGKRITGVRVLQQTDDGSLSQQIDSRSIPTLKSETLTAQSAQIDSVSGATYTSEGYKQSLQSALDKA